VQVFFDSERCKITAQFSDMIPNHASMMQFAAVSFVLLQELWDGKVSRNELMFNNAMQCTGPSCKILQIPSNLRKYFAA
jgi:hypothetical protein